MDELPEAGDASLPVSLTEDQLWALATGRPVTLAVGTGAGESTEVTVRPPAPPEPLASSEPRTPTSGD